VDWAAVVEKLAAGSSPAPDAPNSRTTWLSTINEDGSPHVTAVGALWLDDTFWFQTGAGTRKGRNVARDPRCSIAVSIRAADVVIEGDAARVTEPGALARIAKAWADNGRPAEPDDSGRASLPRSRMRWSIFGSMTQLYVFTVSVRGLRPQAVYGRPAAPCRAARATRRRRFWTGVRRTEPRHSPWRLMIPAPGGGRPSGAILSTQPLISPNSSPSSVRRDIRVRRPGHLTELRPPVSAEIAVLLGRLARENHDWRH
jgi:hypothetical protein